MASGKPCGSKPPGCRNTPANTSGQPGPMSTFKAGATQSAGLFPAWVVFLFLWAAGHQAARQFKLGVPKWVCRLKIRQQSRRAFAIPMLKNSINHLLDLVGHVSLSVTGPLFKQIHSAKFAKETFCDQERSLAAVSASRFPVSLSYSICPNLPELCPTRRICHQRRRALHWFQLEYRKSYV